jgi:hypothetical protein
MKKFLGIVAVVFLMGASAVYGGQTLVNGGAAKTGDYGLEIEIDCSGGCSGEKAFVQDDSPDAEGIYRASFWFNPNDFNLPDGEQHTIFEAKSFNNKDGTNESVAVFRLIVRKLNNGSSFRLRGIAFYDNNTSRRATRHFAIQRTEWNKIQVEWKASTVGGDEVQDSYFKIAVLEGAQAGKSEEIVGIVKNKRHKIEKVQLGVVNGVDTGSVGSHYYDDFESYRTLAP